MDKIKKVFDKLNILKLNEMLSTGNKILKILYVLFIILLIYIAGLLMTQWNILGFIGTILKIISPLFIGFVIAWLLNPLICKLSTKINRNVSVIIVFLGVLLLVYLLLMFTIPALANQLKELVSSIPGLITDIKGWLEGIFDKIGQISLENLDTVKLDFFVAIENYALNLQTNLPEITVNVVSAIASGLGSILMSFVIGFYMCFNFDKISEGLINLLPKRIRKDASTLIERISETSYAFVRGTLWMVLLQMVTNTVGFSIIGLNAPFLIALVCSIFDLIPYVGPYIGATLAAVLGFTQGTMVGVLVLVFILVFQTIQGNFLQPMVMSKQLNLHPVTIIISLLIFGYFWGLLGMLLATPIAAFIKVIYQFFDEKYGFFEYDDTLVIKDLPRKLREKEKKAE